VLGPDARREIGEGGRRNDGEERDEFRAINGRVEGNDNVVDRSHDASRSALRVSIQSVSSLNDHATARSVSGNGLGARPFACSSYQVEVGTPVMRYRSGSRTARSEWLVLIASRSR